MDIPEPDLWVVIPAAGVGSRMRADRPKQYLGLASRMVLEHTLARFAAHLRVRGIVLSIALGDPWWSSLTLDATPPVHVVPGGKARAESVLHALELLNAMGASNDWVLVHDAARPCLALEDFEHLIDAIKHDEVGGILAAPVRDTMKRAGVDGRIACTVQRDGLWHAMTPQIFRVGMLRNCIMRAMADGAHVTDDASAMEHCGYQPRLVEGRVDNIKITRPEDLVLAEWILGRLQR